MNSAGSLKIEPENRVVPLSADRYVVGRSDECDLLLPAGDGAISRRHAILERDHATNTWHVIDLGSRNGTFVGQKRVRDREPLRNGDVIGIGGSRLTLSLSPLIDTASAARAATVEPPLPPPRQPLPPLPAFQEVRVVPPPPPQSPPPRPAFATPPHPVPAPQMPPQLPSVSQNPTVYLGSPKEERPAFSPPLPSSPTPLSPPPLPPMPAPFHAGPGPGSAAPFVPSSYANSAAAPSPLPPQNFPPQNPAFYPPPAVAAPPLPQNQSNPVGQRATGGNVTALLTFAGPILTGLMVFSFFLPWLQVQFFVISGSITYLKLCLTIQNYLSEYPRSWYVYVPAAAALAALVGCFLPGSRTKSVVFAVGGVGGAAAAGLVYSYFSGSNPFHVNGSGLLGLGFMLFAFAAVALSALGIYRLTMEKT